MLLKFNHRKIVSLCECTKLLVVAFAGRARHARPIVELTVNRHAEKKRPGVNAGQNPQKQFQIHPSRCCIHPDLKRYIPITWNEPLTRAGTFSILSRSVVVGRLTLAMSFGQSGFFDWRAGQDLISRGEYDRGLQNGPAIPLRYFALSQLATERRERERSNHWPEASRFNANSSNGLFSRVLGHSSIREAIFASARSRVRCRTPFHLRTSGKNFLLRSATWG